ncbi:MAG TPA: hypothetical protein VK832_10745 [Burkholderiaceae bacterium]|nr:hypothetical protein [Burkholderiaceae bacterium]
MKKFSILCAVLLQFALTASAIAAQDQALVQETRKNQLAHDAQDAKVSEPAVAANKQALSLDHGPRAVVTPWVNQQRKLRAEADAKNASAARDAQNQDGSNR